MGTPCENCIDVSMFGKGKCYTIKSDDVIYSGPSLSCSGINTKDNLTLALQKIDEKLCTMPAQGLQPTLLAGNIATDIGAKFISSSDPLIYTEILNSSVTSPSFIKIGGLSTEYLMADGSVSTLTSFISQIITDGDTTHAPSSDAVYDALQSIYGLLIPVSATESGIVNNIALQELGGVDKLINGVRIGQGAKTTGEENIVFGTNSLYLNTTGSYNTAVGFDALRSNTVGQNNTAIGDWALRNNTVGNQNTAIGANALTLNTTGLDNVAIGVNALTANVSTYGNVAIGNDALIKLVSGSGFNTAIGTGAMASCTTGYFNTAVGSSALDLLTTGIWNTAVGIYALGNTVTGINNTGVGVSAGRGVKGNNCTAIGYLANGDLNSNTGSNNITIGFQAGRFLSSGAGNTLIENRNTGSVTTGSNNIVLNNALNVTGITTGSGNTLIGGISGLLAADANLVVLANGVGTVAIRKNADNTLLAPTQTNALITADATGKAIVTKEYLTSSGSGTVTGTGVAGQVSFWTGTNVQSGSNDFLWDGVNKRLGINVVSTPQAVLDIRSEGNLRVLNMSMYSNTLSDTAAILGARIGGTKASPTAILANTVMATFCATGYNGTGSGNITGRIDVIAKQNFAGANEPTYMTFGTSPVGGIIAVERVRIDSDGNILIGTTTNTGEKFQVSGTTRLGGDTLLTGILSATNSGATQISGINLTNNGTSGSSVFKLTATSSGDGANFTNSSTATGAVISVFNSGIPSGATGVYVQNNAGGRGIFGSNGSNGTLVFLDSATASTGDLLQFRKNNVTTTKFDQNGILSTPPPIITTVPTTSAGTYDVLTRNTSTGQVEKIASSAASYTPTVTSTLNVASSSLEDANYIRLGNIVTVKVSFNVTPTAAATTTQVTLSLPIVRTGTTVLYIGAGSIWNGALSTALPCVAITPLNNNEVVIAFTPTANTAQKGVVTFQYSL